MGQLYTSVLVWDVKKGNCEWNFQIGLIRFNSSMLYGLDHVSPSLDGSLPDALHFGVDSEGPWLPRKVVFFRSIHFFSNRCPQKTIGFAMARNTLSLMVMLKLLSGPRIYNIFLILLMTKVPCFCVLLEAFGLCDHQGMYRLATEPDKVSSKNI